MTQASVEERLDGVSVPIGSKTTRNRLLELLGKHIQRKRSRTDENQQRIKSATQNARARQSQMSTLVPPNAPSSIPTVPLVTPASPPADEVQTRTTDFCKLNDSQLAGLLRTVGFDTGPLYRAQLITQCQAYHELSEFHFVILCTSLSLEIHTSIFFFKYKQLLSQQTFTPIQIIQLLSRLPRHSRWRSHLVILHKFNLRTIPKHICLRLRLNSQR